MGMSAPWRQAFRRFPLLALPPLALVAACSDVTLASLNPFRSPDPEPEPKPAIEAAAPVSRPVTPAELALVPSATPERLSYTVPLPASGRPVETTAALPPERLWDEVLGELQRAGLTIELLDEREGVLVATYQGDPSTFVDCGLITAQPARSGPTRSVEAANAKAAFRRARGSEPVLVQRSLTLQARLVVRLAEAAGQTRVRSDATYVVSKHLTVTGDDGGPPEKLVETIAFPSGGRGTFAKGTICQPTGALERLPLAGANV